MPKRWLEWVLMVCAGMTCAVSGAQAGLLPSAAFIQEGGAGRTRSTTAGLLWEASQRWSLGSGEVMGYWEVSLARWTYDSRFDAPATWLAQFGVTPVFRYRPRAASTHWFADLGIGLTLTTRLYETDRRRFSTRFNFGDHAGLGWTFGEGDRQEIVLRVEHFSNGGLREPNPGLNFVQLRYACRFQ